MGKEMGGGGKGKAKRMRRKRNGNRQEFGNRMEKEMENVSERGK
jgi:hypothetical protein